MLNTEGVNRHEILDKNEQRIKNLRVSLREAQAAMREWSKKNNKPLLLVDSSFNRTARNINQSLERLQQNSWADLARLYIEELYGGQIPQTVQALHEQFFGIPLTRVDTTQANPVQLNNDARGLIFTGSPANITDVHNPEKMIQYGDENFGTTHHMVVQNALTLYNQAAKLNLPVLGICFGHQIVSQAHGGSVERLPNPQIGMRQLAATEFGTSFLSGMTAGQTDTVTGKNVAVFHGDHVVPNPEQSSILLHLADYQPDIIQGLIHVSEKHFTNNPATDKQIVQQLLHDKKHVALTVQGHPEFTGSEPLISFYINGNFSAFTEDKGELADASMLDIFANFFRNYQN
jgi:GMP synthase-like glutamine amidotransferase